MEIIKIVIKGTSGYGPIDEAYTDKVTITADSISYEYKPHPQSQLETNIYRKWSYRTTSPIFRELYRRVAEMVPQYLTDNVMPFVKDTGKTEIIATYEDGHKKKADYFCSSDFFKEWFLLIKKLVPGCEYVPAVLLTEEDYVE